MTTKYFAILTNQGAARLANATALGTKLNITQMAVGDGNGILPTPDPAQTKLINQTRIAPINSLGVDANDVGQIIAEQIIPENEGGFFIREIGLYDDGGILIAVANCPETYKPLLAEGSGRTQTIRMILVVSSSSAITLKIDPSVVLATRKYVDDAVIEVKAYADKLMKDHESKANPHSQYLIIKNALKEIADAGLTGEVLKNLGLTALGVGGAGNLLSSLDWQTFDFVPGSSYAVRIKDMTNTPIGVVVPSNTAIVCTISVEAYDTTVRHLVVGFSIGTNVDFRRYVLRQVGNAGSRAWALRQIWTSGDTIPITAGGTGETTVAGVLTNLGLGSGCFPVGMPFLWGSATPPNLLLPEWSSVVFLKFNGASFSGTTYPKLAKIYPSLVLPDARGAFPRIWDDGRGVDPGRALLTEQGDAIRNISGFADVLYGQVSGNRTGPFFNSNVPPQRYYTTLGGSGVDSYISMGFDAGRVVPVANENRPVNMSFNLFVRAA